MPHSKADDLKDRTKAFAVNVISLCRTLPDTVEGRRIKPQLIDSSTSVAANYRACCRARTRPEFIAKMGIVVEEADESGFWLDLLVETGLATTQVTDGLRREANELTAIFAASLHTAGSRR